jgi:transcriptional regulator with XRE-family HTH domain
MKAGLIAGREPGGGLSLMSTVRRLSRKSPGTANGRRSRAVTNLVLTDLDRTRRDAGISLRRLASACDVSQPYLTQVFAGDREPSISVLTAMSRALGGDLSVRFYPSGGPAIRDRLQAPIVEELVRIAHRSWTRSVEVPVFRPVRGFIDLVLDRSSPSEVVATEVQTRLDRLEQAIRWSQDKARSLPSADMWVASKDEPTIHRLLVLRSTATTRELARRFEGTLRAAYPAPTSALFQALTTADRPWPGHGILWADVRGDAVRILDRPPRGVPLGR